MAQNTRSYLERTARLAIDVAAAAGRASVAVGCGLSVRAMGDGGRRRRQQRECVVVLFCFENRGGASSNINQGDRCNSCPARRQSWSMPFTTIPGSLNLHVNQPDHPHLAGHHDPGRFADLLFWGLMRRLHAEALFLLPGGPCFSPDLALFA